jgi:hypothetical protein
MAVNLPTCTLTELHFRLELHHKLRRETPRPHLVDAIGISSTDDQSHDDWTLRNGAFWWGDKN